jgi:serine/threonine-protein kinase
MFLYVRGCKRTPQGKIDLGLAYMLVNAAGIALLNTWVTIPTTETLGHLSWVTIVILISSMIMPSTPKKMLAASLAAASMDPLGVWIAHLRGFPVPSLLSTIVLCVPNYSCAIVAVLPSRLLHGIGRKLREAQEMGSYQLLELLGTGGMGEVWRAQHRLLARPAAVKLMRPEVLGGSSPERHSELHARFEREAQATASLRSPHTIELYDFGIADDGSLFYVMELLDGFDLETVVERFGPMSAERAVHLLVQVCHSLAEAHAEGLIHRDIKPANVYVCRYGRDVDFVKVLDFGLVKPQHGGPSVSRQATTNHVLAGTPAFMSPEQALDRLLDPRSDIYAVGCLAYWLITGQLVFTGSTVIETILLHKDRKPVPPSQRTGMEIPAALDELILACLEKTPQDRPPTADALAVRLMAIETTAAWTPERAEQWWDVHHPSRTQVLGRSNNRVNQM